MTEPSITCPKCEMTSYNPNDIREEYCGHCHQWHRDMTADEVWDARLQRHGAMMLAWHQKLERQLRNTRRLLWATFLTVLAAYGFVAVTQALNGNWGGAVRTILLAAIITAVAWFGLRWPKAPTNGRRL